MSDRSARIAEIIRSRRQDRTESPRRFAYRSGKPTASRDVTAGRARMRLASVLKSAADALDAIENAEKTEGHTPDIKAARHDLANLIERIADFTDTVTPSDVRATRELAGIERDLSRFPKA
jgi:hypothetical protein